MTSYGTRRAEVLDGPEATLVRQRCARLRKPPSGDWQTLERRLLDALARDRLGGPSDPDGHRSSTGAGGSGSGSGSGLTPVEAAAAARIRARGRQDPVTRLVDQALDMLAQAAASVGAVENLLGQIDKLTADPGQVEHCEACAPAGVLHGWAHYARDLRGLARPMHLCEPVYQFASKRGALPTGEQVRHYDTTGRWLVRVDPTKVAG